MHQSADVTLMLKAASGGDAVASQKLIEVVYTDLKRVARRRMSLEQSGHTLQPTAVVHEVFLRLFRPAGTTEAEWKLKSFVFENRAHFLGLAANQMRQVLIDHARGKKAEKRDFGIKIPMDDAGRAASSETSNIDFEELNEQLEVLALKDPAAAKVVELKFFGGLTDQEVVAVTGTNLTKVRRDWEFARLFLRSRMQRKKKGE